MSRRRAAHRGVRRGAAAGAVVAALVLRAGVAGAQESGPALAPDDAVEAYIERLGLTRLVAEQLALRLSDAAKEERVGIAERLGKMYVQLLTGATDAEERRRWEQRGRDLLRDVPEADTSELRLSLNRAVYVRAEDVVERGRLRLAGPEEVRNAELELRALQPQFTEIAIKAHRRVETLERIEKAGDATEQLASELSEARRIRSLAFYYAGWCHYYIGQVTRVETEAVEALKCFGWLLNSPGGRPASPDRLPAALLRYDHIARAAIGSALACGLRGNDGDAVRWLDLIDESPEVSPDVREQLLLRRITILGEAKRWADLDYFLRKARNADRRGGGEDVRPLNVGAARLLAVVVLEADKRVAGPQIEGLARIALGDLIARQEVAQVLDLVRRYGTAPIGDQGFIVNYVRGLLQFDQARARHKEADAAGEEPAADPETVALYRAAAGMLEAALAQADAEAFPADRGRAAVMLGRCLYFAGDLAVAAERFAMGWELAGGVQGGAEAEEALWLAIVAADRGARAGGLGTGAIAERRAELSALFLQSYPDSPRAARIVLMQAAGGDVTGDEALRILSEVPKDSPVYEQARRQVARMLYQKMRRAGGQDRDFAAMRFVGVAEELLAADRKIAMGQDAAAARQACERLVVRARQMLDALLGGVTPDAARAQAVLEVLEAVAAYNDLDLREHAAELDFRRLQIALARDREAEAIAIADRLASMGGGGGQFGPAADRLIYRRIAARFRSSAQSPVPADARNVVRFGKRVIDAMGKPEQTLRDPAVIALYTTVAGAATSLAGEEGDGEAMRSLAIELDQAVLRVKPRLEESLRRLAVNAEAAGDTATAVGCWNTVFAASPHGSAAWFEARYQSLRLIAAIEPGRARELLDQHALLYPDYGPAPWGEQLRRLAAELDVGAGTPAAAPTGAGGGP